MDAAQALSGFISDWLKRSKHNNLNGLSSRTGISYSTIHRLANERLDRLPLEPVLALLPVVASASQRVEFLQSYYPSLFRLLEKDISFPSAQGVRTDERELDEMMAEPTSFLLAQQLMSKAGVSEKRVLELYGEMGLAAVTKLADQKLVSLEAGRWKTAFDYTCGSIEGSRRQVISSARAFREESLLASCGLLNTISESVSVAGAKAIAEEFQDCLNRVRKLRDENPGDHTFIANVVMHLADPEAALKEGESK